MDNIDNSQRTAAKVAGIAGLLAFVLVVFGNYVLLEPLVVPHNAVDTARNILAHQTQFRFALACFITYDIGGIVLLTALYVVLAPVNRGLALAGALFRLVFVMLWLVAPLNSLGALRFLSDASYLQVFEPERLQALARAQIAASFDDYYVFSGSPDRYDFKLLGKKEMYIPYNNNRFHNTPETEITGRLARRMPKSIRKCSVPPSNRPASTAAIEGVTRPSNWPARG